MNHLSLLQRGGIALFLTLSLQGCLDRQTESSIVSTQGAATLISGTGQTISISSSSGSGSTSTTTTTTPTSTPTSSPTSQPTTTPTTTPTSTPTSSPTSQPTTTPTSTPTPTPTSSPSSGSNPTVSCAVVDGVTDNTQCLQSALQNTQASSDGYIHVVLKPNLTYILQDSLLIQANTILDGSSSTILVPSSFSRQWINFISITGSHVTIQNLTFNYAGIPGAPSGADILTYGCTALIMGTNGTTDITIQNTTITGQYLLFAINLAASALRNINILNSNIHDVGGYGILENSNRATIADIDQNITISGNTITNLGSDGIEFNDAVIVGGSGDPNLVTQNITISNNVISNTITANSSSGFCIGIAGAKYVNITGNTLSFCSWQGIHLEDTSGYVTIQNNTIHDIEQPGDSWLQDTAGVALGGMNVDIINNTFYNLPLAVDIIWGSTSVIPSGDTGDFSGYLYTNNLIIAGNHFSAWTDYAIRVGGSSDQNLNDTIGPTHISGQSWSPANNTSVGPNTYNGPTSGFCVQGSASGIYFTDSITPGC